MHVYVMIIICVYSVSIDNDVSCLFRANIYLYLLLSSLLSPLEGLNQFFW